MKVADQKNAGEKKLNENFNLTQIFYLIVYNIVLSHYQTSLYAVQKKIASVFIVVAQSKLIESATN